MAIFCSPLDHWSDIPDPQPLSVPPSPNLTGNAGANGGLQPSPIVTSSSLTGADPLPTWNTLDSFIPLFELLGPKFVLDQNTYHIHGLVDDNDFEILRDHSFMVTEFILADDGVGNVKPNIAPATFFHIARLLDPNAPLLPCLLRLRIICADTYFPYIHLLHTPSLKALEATDVPDHQHPTFFSFLTTLVHKTPFLEDIILGPGLFPLKTLEAILKFTHLRQLELKDAVSTTDFTLLQGIGTLPNLEYFILDARSCKYIPRIPEEKFTFPSAEHTDVRTKTPQIPSDIDSGRNSPMFRRHEECGQGVDHQEGGGPLQSIPELFPDEPNSSTSMAGGFFQLKKFHFVGVLAFIQEVVPYIGSSTLEDISITLIRLSPENLRQEAEEKSRLAEAQLRRKAEEEKQKMIINFDTVFGVKRSSSKTIIRNKQKSKDIEWQHPEEPREAEEGMAEVQKCRQAASVTAFNLHTVSYITVLQTVSSRWSSVLKAVKFSQLDPSSQPFSIPPILPKQVYMTLVCHPKIEVLDITRWKFDTVEDFLLSLKTSSPKSLKRLHLPIDDPNSAVSLSGLLDIAEACPALESLQCCISTVPEYSVPSGKALHHGLQTLLVANNPTSSWEFNHLLLVARHLYLVFPYLHTIDNVEGPNAEQWVRVRDLVKMFQTIREDDVCRFYMIHEPE